MVAEINRQIRTISHLLHPPLLDEAGLPSALRWYVDGFAERSKIEVNSKCPADFGRLSKEMELSIFRVVQECLTNIHRHSESPTAGIRITKEDGHLTVEIEDAGKGIPLEKRLALAVVGTNGSRDSGDTRTVAAIRGNSGNSIRRTWNAGYRRSTRCTCHGNRRGPRSRFEVHPTVSIHLDEPAAVGHLPREPTLKRARIPQIEPR